LRGSGTQEQSNPDDTALVFPYREKRRQAFKQKTAQRFRMKTSAMVSTLYARNSVRKWWPPSGFGGGSETILKWKER
jgi:hypothetical protein